MNGSMTSDILILVVACVLVVVGRIALMCAMSNEQRTRLLKSLANNNVWMKSLANNNV